MDQVIGVMWNYNEGDILEQTIEAAVMTDIDQLIIADDGSTDKSWSIINACNERHPKITHVQQKPNKRDKGQRQSLLTYIQERFKPEDTWVQLIESDIMICDTSVKEAIRDHNIDNISVAWQAVNCGRKHKSRGGPGWEGYDTYPTWERPIREIMGYAHYMENMVYTFRPLPRLRYGDMYWRPWPKGFSEYTSSPLSKDIRVLNSPLLAHYGYRGPKHFYEKYKYMGRNHIRYKNWRTDSIKNITETVPLFNGAWRFRLKEVSRKGWIDFRLKK